MEAAFRNAFHIISDWVSNHPNSYPPILINITDGVHNEGEDPEPIAADLRTLATGDGNALVFNVYLASEDTQGQSVLFPDRDTYVPNDPFEQKLLNMSSNLVDKMIEYARAKRDKPMSKNAAGFACNANFSDFIDFLDIGTRPAAV